MAKSSFATEITEPSEKNSNSLCAPLAPPAPGYAQSAVTPKARCWPIRDTCRAGVWLTRGIAPPDVESKLTESEAIRYNGVLVFGKPSRRLQLRGLPSVNRVFILACDTEGKCRIELI